jgi:glycerol kinase
VINTGERPVISNNGLLTTVAYRLGSGATAYALEGSIAVTGSLVQWLRDNLGIISSASQVEELALAVEDSGGVIIVPAFSGLFAPHWRPDARGAILGLTRFADRRHIARAALESVAMQTREVVDAAAVDTDAPITELRVDGGMVANDTLMQMQSDALGIPVVRPAIAETTALGAAFAAGLAVGFWSGLPELSDLWQEDRRWEPRSSEAERTRMLQRWQNAVARTLDWPQG